MMVFVYVKFFKYKSNIIEDHEKNMFCNSNVMYIVGGL